MLRSRETDVKVFDGDVESLAVAEIEGVGVRVIVDHRQGYAWAGSLDADVVADTLADARDNAAFGTPDECYGLASPDRRRRRSRRRSSTCGATSCSTSDRRTRSRSRSSSRPRRARPTRASAASSRRLRRRRGRGRGRQLARGGGVDPPHRVLVLGVRDGGRRRRDADRLRLLGRSQRSPTSTSHEAARDAAERSVRLLGATPARVAPPARGARPAGHALAARRCSAPRSAARRSLKGRSMFVGPRGRGGRRAGRHARRRPHARRGVRRRDPRRRGRADAPGRAHRRRAARRGSCTTCTPRGAAGTTTTGSAVRGGFKSTPGVGARALHLVPGARARRGDPRVGARGALRAVGERAPLGHQPGQRRLLGRRRGAHGARRRARGAGARDHRSRPRCSACCTTSSTSAPTSTWLPGGAAGMTLLLGEMTMSGG